MSIQFGVGTLKILDNLVLTNCAVTTAAVSGAPVHNVAITSGWCMIDGVTAIVSANANYAWSLAGDSSGSNLMLYAYIAAGDTITASLAVANSGVNINTGANIPTAICPIARFDYGTGNGTIAAGSIVAWSGGSATKSFVKIQNVSIPITYESSQMRGGADVFPCDTKFFDGVVEGSWEMGDTTAQNLLFLGGIYASGASAGSGTWTLSGDSRPKQFSLVFQNVTDGRTATYTILRAYISQVANDFSRTDFLRPTFNFVAQANNQGTVLKIEG